MPAKHSTEPPVNSKDGKRVRSDCDATATIHGDSDEDMERSDDDPRLFTSTVAFGSPPRQTQVNARPIMIKQERVAGPSKSKPENTVNPSVSGQNDMESHSSATKVNQPSSFSPPSVVELARRQEIGYLKGEGRVPVPCCELYEHLNGQPEHIMRLLTFSTFPFPIANLDSLYMADPKKYTWIPAWAKSPSRRVIPVVEGMTATVDDKDACFFLVGRVTHSALLAPSPDSPYNRSVSIQLIHRFAPRTFAVMRKLLGLDNGHITVFKDGIVVSTAQKPYGVSHGPTSRTGPFGDVPRKWDSNVPIYDGRHPFRFSEYTKLTELDTEFNIGDFILCAVALNGYTSAPLVAGQPGLERMSLNILFSILMERPRIEDAAVPTDKVHCSLTDETPLGVSEKSKVKSDFTQPTVTADPTVEPGPVM